MAPESSRLVRDLAQRKGCSTCAFYRNEKRPNVRTPTVRSPCRGKRQEAAKGQRAARAQPQEAEGQGPPYGLLQGRIDVTEVAPREGNIPVKCAGRLAASRRRRRRRRCVACWYQTPEPTARPVLTGCYDACCLLRAWTRLLHPWDQGLLYFSD